MEITPLRNNDSLYRIVETINQLVDSKNPELSISNTLISAANSEKVKYTATDDTFITGEVFTITIPGMYQIYTKGVGRSKYAIKHIKDNSYIQSEEKADAYISDEYLLSAGDQVFFWAVGASHQELTITLKLTASFYDIIERLLGSESKPDNPNYSRVTSVAGKTGEVELDKSDVGLEKVDNIRQYSESNPPPYPVTSVNGNMGAVTLTKSDMGLSNLDNIRQYSASNPPPYPVSSVAGKTGAVALVKADIGLGNVDNTTDANKPISTATQTALNQKAPIANPTFTGTVTAPDVNVTGNMRLKGSGNYGNILNFGDGDYVHIAESSNDVLELKGTQIKLYTGGTLAAHFQSGKLVAETSCLAGKSTVSTSTLSVSSWTSANLITLSNSAWTSSTIIEILPALNITQQQLEAYQGANLQEYSQSAGSVTLKAWGTKPTVNIPIRIITRGDM